MQRKKYETTPLKTKVPLVISTLKELTAISVQKQRSSFDQPNKINKTKQNKKNKFYQWCPQNVSEQKMEQEIKLSNIKQALKYKITPELANKIMFEVKERDPWSAEIYQLKMPKLIEQLTLNAYKKSLNETEICLHLRSTHRHLNTKPTHKALTKTLTELYGKPIKLIIIDDNNVAIKTPLEWRRLIYKEKLTQARQSIFMDKTIQALCKLFDAQLDEKSICPI